ncbi:hypothetical protein [Tepidimicrobium xylanilyticum]|uniref:Uncharacterized protein n=1 Tax=Tepidimicrobium xylanilyticum TaxID=1123352 RepID=A0A1H3BDE1_9FIRM|nr:hypothetical protein [Tepidimicrobium xylanilyticum]GMG96930.1 hypothetical protein EN5CB1_17560 [Tepidimicrobium xylanilyticum]SDX39926.1 hypothetical protein SAMN05660923_02246 [Tepidimicrobium xylanilyticum]
MNKVKILAYTYLTNEQLIDFTLEEIENLKKLSELLDPTEYENRLHLVNQLIMEVKRRNLSIKKPLLAMRILSW